MTERHEDLRPCGLCWGHMPGEGDCPAEDYWSCECKPEGGLAEIHPECDRAAIAYTEEARRERGA